jgi:hypothetical protein
VRGIAAVESGAALSASTRRLPIATGSLLSSARATRLAAATGTPRQEQQQPGQHAHSHSHSSFGSVSFTCNTPLCMACFQACVAQHLLTARGVC